MSKKVILSADSTCDLNEALVSRYNVHIIPLSINFGDEVYQDGVTIKPDEIFARFAAKGELPKTSAINTTEYIDIFKPWVDEGYEVVHINIGRALSYCHTSALLAAEQLEGVYVIDSCNLSTGSGLLVIEAANRIAAGMEAAQVAEEVRALTAKSHATFVLDTLKFMAAGGRCTSVMAFGANLLQIKPSIQVDNSSGALAVDKKYRGNLVKVLAEYVDDQMKRYDHIRKDRVFITHSGISDEIVDMVRGMLEKQHFAEIHVTRAGCTISCHCGPNCLGVLFMTE